MLQLLFHFQQNQYLLSYVKVINVFQYNGGLPEFKKIKCNMDNKNFQSLKREITFS